MKLLRVLISLVVVFLFQNVSFANVDQKYDPLLVVVIMVKDETDVIRPTLEMYCRADPEGKKIAYLVYDTGLDPWSSTMSKAKELFDDYHITNYYIIQEPFVDFATSRNKALDLVIKNFPNAAFMLMPDAEWYLHGVPELLAFCEAELTNFAAGSYLVRIISTDLDFGTQRLIRCSSGLRFGGVVHETIMIGTRFKTPDAVFFELRPGRYGVEKTQKRWKRDKDLLLKAFESNTKDSRSAFYLAQTCDCLGQLEDAYKYYEIRTHLIGWDEEDMIARYRLAQVLERMKNEDGSSRWPEAIDHYLQAFTMRPTRAETIIRVAGHYLAEGNHACAYNCFRPASLMRWAVHLGSQTRSTSTLLMAGMPARRLFTCSKMSPLAGHCGVVRVMVTLTHCLGQAGVESGSGPVVTP